MLNLNSQLVAGKSNKRRLTQWQILIAMIVGASFLVFAVTLAFFPAWPPMVFSIAAAQASSLFCVGSHQSQIEFFDIETKHRWVSRCPEPGVVDRIAIAPAGDLVAVTLSGPTTQTVVFELNGHKIESCRFRRVHRREDKRIDFHDLRFVGTKGESLLMSRPGEWELIPLGSEKPEVTFIDLANGWTDRRERHPLPKDISNELVGSGSSDYDEATGLVIAGFHDGRLIEIRADNSEWRLVRKFNRTISSAKWLDSQNIVLGFADPIQIVVCRRDGTEVASDLAPGTSLAVVRSKCWILSTSKFGDGIKIWRFENDQLIPNWQCRLGDDSGMLPWSSWSQLLGLW